MDNQNQQQSNYQRGGGNYQNNNNNYQRKNYYQNNNNNYQNNNNNQSNYGNSNNYQQNKGQQQIQQTSTGQSQLKNICFDLSEIYFPLFILQMRFDIFALRNRAQRQNYQGQLDQLQSNNNDNANGNQPGMLSAYEAIADSDYELLQEYQRQYYESMNKFFFILRDQFLLNKIQICGIMVFIIKREEKYIFGIDDSTGVMTCVLWLNDNKQGGQSARRNQDFRNLFANITIGSSLAILGTMEYYKDKIQVNVHKLRPVIDINEEMLQYQQTINAQKCYFEPFKPFQRRLFNSNWQQEQQTMMEQQRIIQEQKQQAAKEIGDGEDFHKHKINRIKKNINDYILNNYHDLFKSEASKNQGELTSPNKVSNNLILTNPIPLDHQNITVSEKDFLENKELLGKIIEEIKFSDQRDKDPKELLKECLGELEQKGFVNLLGDTMRQYIIQIKEQKNKLKLFIEGELKRSNGMPFETIYKNVCQEYNSFYTKGFVFKIIDELFQMGCIYEKSKLNFAYLDNQF
eukprot:403352426